MLGRGQLLLELSEEVNLLGELRLDGLQLANSLARLVEIVNGNSKSKRYAAVEQIFIHLIIMRY
jgi:hypothetical protein